MLSGSEPAGSDRESGVQSQTFWRNKQPRVPWISARSGGEIPFYLLGLKSGSILVKRILRCIFNPWSNTP